MSNFDRKNVSIQASNGGCLTFVLGCIVLWALIFGVNYKGKHYGLSCKSNGVTVHDGE